MFHLKVWRIPNPPTANGDQRLVFEISDETPEQCFDEFQTRMCDRYSNWKFVEEIGSDDGVYRVAGKAGFCPAGHRDRPIKQVTIDLEFYCVGLIDAVNKVIGAKE